LVHFTALISQIRVTKDTELTVGGESLGPGVTVRRNPPRYLGSPYHEPTTGKRYIWDDGENASVVVGFIR